MTTKRKRHPTFEPHRATVGPEGNPIASWFTKQPLKDTGISVVVCSPTLPALPLDRVLREAFDGLSWTRCRTLIDNGKVTIDGELARDIRRLVLGGSIVRVDPTARKLNGSLTYSVKLVYWDSQIVVVEKPAGISTVPFDETEPDTLDELTRRALGKVLSERLPPLGVVHRIDKETSGLVVFARTTAAKRHLKQQFRFHTNHREYFALISGRGRTERIESRIVENRGDGRRGSTSHPSLGQQAITHVEVIELLRDVTLVRCRLETGRTHQIRIHLSERGHPLLGDRVYGSAVPVVAFPVPRLMLHAAELGVTHPTRDERMTFRSELPSDFARVLQQLRTRT